MFSAILFDLIGTTVKEEGDVVTGCIEDAFKKHAAVVDTELIRANRGKEKKTMIAELLAHHQYPLSLLQPVYQSFLENFSKSIGKFSENAGAGGLFLYAKSKGIKIGIGTGLPADLFDKIWQKLDWDKYAFDYIGLVNGSIRSRPYPDMIYDMMQKTGVPDPSSFLKVGDTAADILEGKNAGVKTAIILSGSQSNDSLLELSPDFSIESLMHLKAILENN